MKLARISSRQLFYRTVLWIGDREANEVREAYETAELCSSQIAYRPSLASAIDRSASDVDFIVVAPSNRTTLSDSSLDELNRRHPSAIRVLLQTPLCAGVRIPGDRFFGDHRHSWLEGGHVLQRMLGGEQPVFNEAGCVAVMASNFSAAETLLQVAEDAGCSAFWCRSEGSLAIRGVNTVWWDDSLAIPTDTEGWTKRLQAMAPCLSGDSVTHTWITNRVHWLQVQQANEAGVGRVLTKPFPLELLTESLGVVCGVGRMEPKRHPALESPRRLPDVA